MHLVGTSFQIHSLNGKRSHFSSVSVGTGVRRLRDRWAFIIISMVLEPSWEAVAADTSNEDTGYHAQTHELELYYVRIGEYHICMVTSYGAR